MQNKQTILIIFLIALLILTIYTPLALATNGWSKTYGTTGDNEAKCVVQISDGGYILAGFTNSSGSGGYDAWIIKTDVAGNVQWEKTYGGPNDDKAYEIIQIDDGGYAFAGTTNMVVATNNYDEWLVKIDSSGNELWEQTYLGLGEVNSLFQTSDGGYFIGSNWGLVRTDAQGKVVWSKTTNDFINCLTQSSDGDYVYLTTSYDANGGFYPNLVKIDLSGNIQFSQPYKEGWANSVVQTNDGGYAFAGYTMENKGTYQIENYWLGKADSNGNLQWNQTYLIPGKDNSNSAASSLIQTKDGGYAMAGITSGVCGLLKVDSNGKMQWNKVYQGQEYGYAPYSLIQTNDGGFALAGFVGEMFLAKSGPSYLGNFLLLKTDENGATSGTGLSTESPSSSQATSQSNSVPLWAFNGAYAKYETTINNAGVVEGLELTLTINNVNREDQTCDISFTNNASIASLTFTLQQSSIGEPHTILLGLSDLGSLNNGQFPSANSSSIQVITKQLVSVPAGTFVTDEIIPGGNSNNEWIDMYSGVLVKASPGSLGNVTTTDDLRLTASNICLVTSASNATISDGTAIFDDSAVTGVKVTLADLASSGNVNIIVTNLGTELPPATGALQVNAVAFYDVLIVPETQFSQKATSTIYLTNSAFTSNDNTLQYWDGNSWVQTTTTFSAPNTITATIPVSALTGTLIAVEPKAQNNLANNIFAFPQIVVIISVLMIVLLAVILVILRKRKKKGRPSSDLMLALQTRFPFQLTLFQVCQVLNNSFSRIDAKE